MKDQPIFKYPWDELEAYLEAEHQKKLTLLAYGSLMNAKSASQTLSSHKPMNRKAVHASGVRRVFNYKMPEAAYSRYGKPLSEKHIAALNLLTTNDKNDSVNGILQSVDVSDLGRFREREVGYQLSPVNTFDWKTRKRIDCPVYALELTNPETDILPHLYYLEVCSEGALSISQEFQRAFYETTFLADLETNLIDWIKGR